MMFWTNQFSNTWKYFNRTTNLRKYLIHGKTLKWELIKSNLLSLEKRKIENFRMQNASKGQSEDIIFFNKTKMGNSRVMTPQISFIKGFLNFNSLITFWLKLLYNLRKKVSKHFIFPLKVLHFYCSSYGESAP